MEQLCYETLEKAGYTGYLLKNAPERVLQFGEGNFLRAFADYWFDMANEKAGWNGKCVLVQPIAQGLTQRINRHAVPARTAERRKGGCKARHLLGEPLPEPL